MLNNINLEALNEFAQSMTDDPKEGIAALGVVANWKSGVKSTVTTLPRKIGSKAVNKQFSFEVGEPEELLGDDLTPMPHDYLLGGMASCMMVTYVALATKRGLKLDSVKIIIRGDLDFAGFMEVNPDASVGYEKLDFNFEVTGKGTQEEFMAIAEHVRKISPAYRTIADEVDVVFNKQLSE